MNHFETIEDTIKYHSIMPAGKLVECGVYHGDCLKRLIDGFEKANYKFETIYGFDSFEGLPEETPGVYVNPDWPKGAFSVKDRYGLKSIDDAVEFVRYQVGHPEVNYIAGYFSETFTPEMAEEIGKESISYLHCDVDIHSSSLQVLEFVFKYRLLAIGAIIRFDDILSTPSNGGQKLALAQVINKYQFVLSQLSANVFQLISYDNYKGKT